MRKSIALFSFLVLSSVCELSAQSTYVKLRLGAISGYDFYRQGDLKFLNQSLTDMLPFEVSVIDDFSPKFFWGVYAQYELFKHLHLGPSYEYHYTGSRVGARDYSGAFSFDQYVRVHQIGLKSDYLFLQAKRLFFDAEVNAGFNLTSWKMDNYLKIEDNGDPERQIDYLNGFGWYLSPAIQIGYLVNPRINLTGTVGYTFDLKEKYRFKGFGGSNIVKTPEWDGLKLSIGIEFKLK